MNKLPCSMAIDLDGVIFDFESEFCEKFGYDNRNLFDLHKRYPNVDKGLIDEFIASPTVYENLFPIFGSIFFLNQVRDSGIDIVLLTSRPKSLKEITVVALKQYNISYTELIFSYDKSQTILEFNRFYRTKPIKWLLDDRVDNVKSLPVGVVGMVWEQPWNWGFYPRVRYNSHLMSIEVRDNALSEWKELNWRY